MLHPTQRTLFFNGDVRTVDAAQPRVQALAVEGERLLAVGTDDEILALARPGDVRLDLRGRTVLPGFEDAHVHLVWCGQSLQHLVLTGARSLEEALEQVRVATASLARSEWLLGSGWNHNLWPRPEWPTRYDLDAVVADRPVVLTSKDGHSQWLNSAALRAVGISAETPNPPGGEILRNAHGEPIGTITENTMELVKQAAPAPDDAAVLSALRRVQQEAARYGVTSVHNCEGSAPLAGLQHLERAGELSLRVWQMVRKQQLSAALELRLASGFGSPMLRIGHLKMFADGALGSATAEMLVPYEDLPGVGVASTPTEELYASARSAALQGLASAIHAIGDAANRRVLDLYAQLRAEGIFTPIPHRIEHVQLLDPADLPRLAALGVVASMQPIHAPQDRVMADLHWGARARYGYAWASVLRSGALLVMGTDTPVEALNPLANLHAAVTRRSADGQPAGGWYPQEALTLEQALYAYTQAPAVATGEAHLKGSLTPGKLADLVVLSRALDAREPDALLETQVDLTMLGGRVLFERED
jgi:hypothetical protein